MTTRKISTHSDPRCSLTDFSFSEWLRAADWKSIALYVGCAAYVGFRDFDEMRTGKGLLKLVSSAALALGLSEAIATWGEWPIQAVTVFIMLFGVGLANVIDGFIADRERVIALFLRVIGKTENDANDKNV